MTDQPLFDVPAVPREPKPRKPRKLSPVADVALKVLRGQDEPLTTYDVANLVAQSRCRYQSTDAMRALLKIMEARGLVTHETVAGCFVWKAVRP